MKNNYTIHCFGFPIIIEKVPIEKFQDHMVPDIDYEAIEKEILQRLPYKKGGLTGNQVRYLRLYFEKTLEQFAELFGITHAAVSKWEKKENRPTGMNVSTEMLLRVFVLSSAYGYSMNRNELSTLLELIRDASPQEPFVIKDKNKLPRKQGFHSYRKVYNTKEQSNEKYIAHAA